MAGIKVSNISLKSDPSSEEKEEVKKRVKDASSRKKQAEETIEEAWTRIFNMKNSDTDSKRLKEVKVAMDSGEIGREPTPEGKKQKRFSKTEALRLFREIERKRIQIRLKEMADNVPNNYWLIQDEMALKKLTDLLDNEKEIVFDVETTGTNVREDYIVGHVITAIESDIHAYIPTKHKTGSRQLPNEMVLNYLKPYYEDESLGKLAHNAKFDIHMLSREGITLRGLSWDTQEAMRMLNENEGSFALKVLVTKYLGIESETYEELFGQVGFDNVSDLLVALAYAAKDGDVTRKLRDFQRYHLSRFPEILEYYEAVEVPITSVVQQMEATGFDIDLEFADKYGKEIKKDIDRLYEELISEIGDVNLNSPPQLKAALEEVTGEELESTDAKKVLKPLKGKYPIIAKLLAYKEKFKLYSTYINALPELIDKVTGKLYTNFNQNGARTGRFSSGGTGVNLQNQPKEARKLFVAPEGYVILGGDWSQQEFRCLAYFTQDPGLVDNYKAENDLYAAIASEVFNKPIEECGDGTSYRDRAKVIMLAVVYGGGANMLKDAIGVTKRQAQEFLANFFKNFPVVKKWIEQNQDFVKKHGYVWMDKNQRKRRLPAARDRNAKGHYSSVFTQSTNARVQGSSAIQTKVTMIELQKLCERKTAEGKGEWRIWCVVHDEALLQVPDTVTKQDVRDFEDVMINSYKFGDIPNKTDLEFYKRWGVGISEEEWFTA